MSWETELLKEIQRQEDRIVVGASKETIKAAQLEMERLTNRYIKQTKPVSKPADVNFIGRNTYSSKGELIRFYLEQIVKFREYEHSKR